MTHAATEVVARHLQSKRTCGRYKRLRKYRASSKFSHTYSITLRIQHVLDHIRLQQKNVIPSRATISDVLQFINAEALHLRTHSYHSRPTRS